MFELLIGLALAAVLGVLVIGLVSMSVGGDFNRRHGNRLMRLRVTLQAAALGLMLLAFLFGGGPGR